MSGAGDHFDFATRHKGADHWNVRIAKCSVCGKTEDVRDSKANGLPVSAVAQKFRQRGWEIGSRRNKDRCPEHSRVPGAMDMAGKDRRQRRAAFVAIGRREGSIPPAEVVVVDGASVLRNIGALAMADPVTEVMDAATAAARLEVLGRVTRREPEKAPEPAPPPPEPRVKPRPKLTVDHPMFDPPPGTDVFIRRIGRGGHASRQTGWKPDTPSNVRMSARNRLGGDAKLGDDFALFTEADGTMGWKPLRKVPTPYTPPIVTDPPFIRPSQETPMPEQPTQGGSAAVEHDWTAPEYTPKRRKVLDYLDTHYDGVNRYRGDGSDRKTAEELDVPRGLVAHVRAQFFGPDANEVAEQTVRELKTLRHDATKLVEKHMNLAAEAEAFAARASAALSKLGV